MTIPGLPRNSRCSRSDLDNQFRQNRDCPLKNQPQLLYALSFTHYELCHEKMKFSTSAIARHYLPYNLPSGKQLVLNHIAINSTSSWPFFGGHGDPTADASWAIYKLTSMNMPISGQQLSVPLGNGLAKSAGMLRATISLFHY